MSSVSLLFADEEAEVQGNLLLDRILGTKIVRLPFPFQESSRERIEAEAEKAAAQVRAEGHVPYFIPAGGASPLGALGYLRATEELAHQARREGCRPDAIIVPYGTGGTLAGVLLGLDALRLDWTAWGISVAAEGAWEQSGISPLRQIAREAASLLGLEFRLPEERCTVLYDYVGPAYGALTEGCAEAIRTVARTDGILLDPVYTGKAMAGLLDLVRTRRLVKGQTVIFLHTGGAPALFAHPELASI
jgi:1-aminocyclopropane-1-carboxylate deaminase/D-cysteine desulfhydrase-like pyridoxal-dependent ACC family enzyme